VARIVFAAFGSLGDLHPLIAVARAMAARGHHAIVATHGGHRERVERAGLRFAPMRPDLTQFGDPREVMRRAMDSVHGTAYVLNRLTLPFVRATTEDVLAAAQGADALVHGALVLGASSVGERLGIPWIPVVMQPAAMISALDPPHVGLFRWTITRPIRPALARLMWSVARAATSPLFAEVGRLRRAWGLPPLARHPVLEIPREAACVLALYSRHLAPPASDWPPNARITGFPFHDEGAFPDTLRAFLDAGEPPVVFTLGSSAVMAAGDFYRHAAHAAGALGVRSVLLVGDTPDRLPDPLPPGSIVAPYAPYAPLLARSRAVVHQAGIGTTGQVLRAGRPSLMVPFSHDQPDNARRVADLGAGRVLPRARLTAATLRASLEALLADRAIHETAERLGRAVRAERGADEAADAIEAVLAGRAGFGAGVPDLGMPTPRDRAPADDDDDRRFARPARLP
jgi:MGT family glycosyltransferase